MPLFDLDGRRVSSIPLKKDFDVFRGRLNDAEWAAIAEWINGQIDGREIRTAGWLAPRLWEGTPLLPIYAKATTKKNFDLAGKCFGLFVFVVFMDRAEDWFSGRFELNGTDIGSRTYFQKT
jgi:hypothetical protein